MHASERKGGKAAITAVGGYVPEERLTNQDLEQMVATTDEWIRSRTGIESRRILKDTEKATSYLAIKAAENLIEKNQIDPLTIDMVLVATITPDLHVASTAPYVASQINAQNAFAFDLQAACSGFLYGLSVAAGKIAAGHYKKILVIGADKMSSIIDYTDRTTCIIFGDGAGAVLLEPSTNGMGWEDEYLRSNGMGRDLLHLKGGGSLHPASQQTLEDGWHALYQDGKSVFKHAVSEMATASEILLERNGLHQNDIDFLVPHQANQRIIEATAKKMDLPMEKVLCNIADYGNTTAATIPLLLHDFECNFKKGDKLVLTAFGGGFTWGAALLTWAYN
jgi:3-oxoacyl-[acyl-carrier-protein] synthase III